MTTSDLVTRAKTAVASAVRLGDRGAEAEARAQLAVARARRELEAARAAGVRLSEEQRAGLHALVDAVGIVEGDGAPGACGPGARTDW